MQLVPYEDLLLGAEWSTRARTIAEVDFVNFAGVTGDFSPYAVDARAAAAGPFGGRIAPAAFISALALGLGSMDVPQADSAGLVGMTWRYDRPVRPAETIRARFRLARKRDVDNPLLGLVTFQITVETVEGVVAAEGEINLLVRRRAALNGEATAAPAKKRRRRSSRAKSSVTTEGGDTGPEAFDVPVAATPARVLNDAGPASLATPGGTTRPVLASPTAVGAMVDGAPIPDAAPGDVPSPARRRRRRRPTNSSGASVPGTTGVPHEPAAPSFNTAGAPRETAPNAGGAIPGGSRPAQSRQDPPRNSAPAPPGQTGQTGQSGPPNVETPISRVLRRFRRPR